MVTMVICSVGVFLCVCPVFSSADDSLVAVTPLSVWGAVVVAEMCCRGAKRSEE